MFRILDLPPELIGNVCDYVGRYDLQRLRLSCKALKAHSITSFGTRFFDHLIAFLHPLSLGVLLEISRHTDLSKFVKRITISGEKLRRCTTKNDELLLSMQTTMGKSGLDILMLTEIFKSLHNLASAQIDTSSYQYNNHIQGLRCGYSSLMPFGRPEGDFGPFVEEEHGYTRVFKSVFQALELAGAHERVLLDLCLYHLFDDGEEIRFFDTDGALWVNSLSRNVRKLAFLCETNTPWCQDLLKSTPNIENLTAEVNGDTFQLCHPNGDMFHWPKLRHLDLDDVTFSHVDLVAFLELHRSTVAELEFQGVNIQGGSWMEPFQIMRQMPKLKLLLMCLLYAQTPTASPVTNFDIYGTPNLRGAFYQSTRYLKGESVHLALDVLMGDLSMTASGPRHDWQRGRSFVDFRKVGAAMKGQLGLEGTDWKLKE